MKVLENLKQIKYIQNPHNQKDEKAGPQQNPHYIIGGCKTNDDILVISTVYRVEQNFS